MFKKQQGIEYIDLRSKSGQERKFFKAKYLGSGGFARCYEIYEQVNGVQQHYAFKIIKKSTLYQTKQLIDRLRTEIKLHKKFSQPNETTSSHIVRFIQSFQTQDYIYLLLELCVNQTLNELIRRRKFLTEEETRFYIWQLATGLKEIHSSHVVHRDIKLCNLFLSTGLKIKIGDFGLATEIQQNRKRYTMCGTANYIAPEMIKKDHLGGSIGHGYEVDVWAMGVVCYTIFFGKYPFEAQEEQQIYDKVLACKYSFNPYSMKEIKELNINTLNHFPSEELKSFIKGIFQLDPAKRMTLDEVLAHEFLNITTVPKELPQISLKCNIKKDTLDKLFVKKEKNTLTQKQEQNNKESKSGINQQIKPQQSKDQIQKVTPSELSAEQQTNTNEPNYEILFKKTQSTQTKQEQTQTKQADDQQIKNQIQNVKGLQNGKLTKTGSLFVKFERRLKPSSLEKIDSVQVLLEIILSKPITQNESLKNFIENGFMIKVYNMRQGEQRQSTKIQYTILLHPKLNYLTKVFEAPKASIFQKAPHDSQRIPLEQVNEKPKNIQSTLTNSKQKVVVKIPLTKQSYSKNQNKRAQKYMEELSIAKMVYNYLNHKMNSKSELNLLNQTVAN